MSINAKILKNIRRYADIQIAVRNLPLSHRKRIHKAFKHAYEMCTPQQKIEYQEEMAMKFAQQAALKKIQMEQIQKLP